jgi:hypothetical protein
MIARSTAMAPAAAVQRKAIGLAAVVAIAVGGRLGLLRRLRGRLTSGDKGRQPVHIRVAGRRRHVLGARLEML